MNRGNQLTVRRFWDPYPQTFWFVMNCYHPQTKLREDNVFTPVCQSFCSQGEVVFVWCHFLSGYLVPCSFQGSLSLVPCFFGGGGVFGFCPGRPPDRDPLCGKGRAVRILLECILVSSNLRRIHEDSNRKNSNVYLSKACKGIFDIQHAYNSNLSFDTFQ